MEKIRFEQARLLKKEEKWADAIEMYLLGYLAKSSWNRKFQEDMFVKDIKSSANKLNWDDSVKAGEPVLVPDLPGSEGKLLRRIWRSKSPGRPDGAAAVRGTAYYLIRAVGMGIRQAGSPFIGEKCRRG